MFLAGAQVQVWDFHAAGGYGAFFPMLFDMDVNRAAHTVTPLGDGRFFIAGGLGTGLGNNESRTTIFLPSE